MATGKDGKCHEHGYRIEQNEKKHEIATASRANLHKKDEELESRMDKWSWIAFGFATCATGALGIMGSVLACFWWLIGNETVIAALTAVKDAG